MTGEVCDPEAAEQDQIARQEQEAESERIAVRGLGRRIGYGNMMHLASAEWRVVLANEGHAGGEFAVGPCVGATEPCVCPPGEAHRCGWCCGSGWLTHAVAALVRGQR